MRFNRNLLIFIFSASLITGCGESEIKKELNALKLEIAERRAEIDYLERQASISAACDFIVPLCPDTVAATGRQAQKNGFGGGADWPFWLSVAAKMAAIGTSIGCMISAAGAVWVRLGRPAVSDIERARKSIRDAEVAEAKAESQKKADQERLHDRLLELKQAKDELEKVRRDISSAAQLLQQHKKEIESIQAAKAAISAFHT